MSRKIESRNDWENHFKWNKGLILSVLLLTVILKQPVFSSGRQVSFENKYFDLDQISQYQVLIMLSELRWGQWSLLSGRSPYFQYFPSCPIFKSNFRGSAQNWAEIEGDAKKENSWSSWRHIMAAWKKQLVLRQIDWNGGFFLKQKNCWAPWLSHPVRADT